MTNCQITRGKQDSRSQEQIFLIVTRCYMFGTASKEIILPAIILNSPDVNCVDL
jgi:hypothetical protein